jgi:hypothetical protein
VEEPDEKANTNTKSHRRHHLSNAERAVKWLKQQKTAKQQLAAIDKTSQSETRVYSTLRI